MASSSMDSNIQASSSTEISSNNFPNGHPTESLIQNLNHDLLGLAVHESPQASLHSNHPPASDGVSQPIPTREEDDERRFRNHSPSKLRTAIQTQHSSASALCTKESPTKNSPENQTRDQDDVLLDMASQTSTASFKPHCRGVHAQKPQVSGDLFRCPVHNVVGLNDGGADEENAINGQQLGDKLSTGIAYVPLQRYLAEGVAERYALLGSEQVPERGEGGVRECLCEKLGYHETKATFSKASSLC